MPSDIFLSYSEKDRQKAAMLADAFAGKGWSIWWDRRIPAGEIWADTIEEALKGARCVMVLWSGKFVKSKWVKKEARYAEKYGMMVPVFIDNVEPPFEFERLQALDLSTWHGEESPTFRSLVAGLRARLQTSSDKPTHSSLR